MIEFLLGLISGMVTGMGMGGGTLLIPGLVLFMNVNQKTAQGINLLYFMPSAVAALILHIKNRYIRTHLLIYLISGGLLGALLGSFLAVYISNDFLKKIFAVFLIIMGVYEIFCKEGKKADNPD